MRLANVRLSPTRLKSAGFVEPCIPTEVSRPPEGQQWVHEVKDDGYRLIAVKRDDDVHLYTRRDLTGRRAIR